MRYKVTPEIYLPSRWKRFLRFLRLIKKREEYYLRFTYDGFSIGDTLYLGVGNNILIIGKE